VGLDGSASAVQLSEQHHDQPCPTRDEGEDDVEEHELLGVRLVAGHGKFPFVRECLILGLVFGATSSGKNLIPVVELGLLRRYFLFLTR
jgi:hypothetical protein